LDPIKEIDRTQLLGELMSFISVGDGTIVNSAHIIVIVPNNVTGGCDVVMDDGRTLRDTRTAEQLAKAIGRKA
jgi:hypothetical protein